MLSDLSDASSVESSGVGYAFHRYTIISLRCWHMLTGLGNKLQSSCLCANMFGGGNRSVCYNDIVIAPICLAGVNIEIRQRQAVV